MCGAISGFHALVSSGTTPKMISRESHIRTIGYGAMLIEGLVGVVALIAAATLPQGDYYAINIGLDQGRASKPRTSSECTPTPTRWPQIEQQVGGESLRGRTGGAVTLAVGMSKILNDATDRVTGGAVRRLVGHQVLVSLRDHVRGPVHPHDDRHRHADRPVPAARGARQDLQAVRADRSWLPGAILSTAVVTAGWGLLIATGSIDTIWPMFGIANQMLAVIALSVVTTVMINTGRGRYAWLTILPMLFVIATTSTAGIQMSSGKFARMLMDGIGGGNIEQIVKGGLNLFFTLFILAAVMLILGEAVIRWVRGRNVRPQIPNLKSQI